LYSGDCSYFNLMNLLILQPVNDQSVTT